MAVEVEVLTISDAHFLPSELVKKSNYSDVAAFSEEIATILAYTEILDSALVAFNSAKTDKLDVNVNELDDCIDLTRTVCGVLGRSEKVCFEILIKLRECLKVMQQVRYLAKKYGDQYIGVASKGGEI